MAPYAWEVEEQNAKNKIAEGRDNVAAGAVGQPTPGGAGLRHTGLEGPNAGLAGQPGVGVQGGDQSASAAVGVRTPAGDDQAATDASGTTLKVGDTARLKGGKGQTFKIDALGADGKVSGTVVSKGGSKGGKVNYSIDEIEAYAE